MCPPHTYHLEVKTRHLFKRCSSSSRSYWLAAEVTQHNSIASGFCRKSESLDAHKDAFSLEAFVFCDGENQLVYSLKKKSIPPSLFFLACNSCYLSSIKPHPLGHSSGLKPFLQGWSDSVQRLSLEGIVPAHLRLSPCPAAPTIKIESCGWKGPHGPFSPTPYPRGRMHYF